MQAEVDRLLQTLAIDIAPFTDTQSRLAVEAFVRYGKGRKHGAALNFGDCCRYAAAVDLGLPLLFEGEDFSRTDVAVA